MATVKVLQFRNSRRRLVSEDEWCDVMKDQADAGNYQAGVIEYAAEGVLEGLPRELRMYVVANTSPRFKRVNNVADVTAPMYGDCVGERNDTGVNLTPLKWKPLRYYLLHFKK